MANAVSSSLKPLPKTKNEKPIQSEADYKKSGYEYFHTQSACNSRVMIDSRAPHCVNAMTDRPQNLVTKKRANSLIYFTAASSPSALGEAQNIRPDELLTLVQSKDWGKIQELASNEKIQTKHLDTILTQGPDAGVNVVWLLAANQQWELLNSLKEKITSEHLSSALVQEGQPDEVNVVWLLAANQQWDLFSSLIEKITSEHLASAPKHGPNAGKNLIWLLAANQQWEILSSLKEKITSEHLASAPEHGPEAERSALWILAYDKQFELLNFLNGKITDTMCSFLMVN